MSLGMNFFGFIWLKFHSVYMRVYKNITNGIIRIVGEIFTSFVQGLII